MRVVEKHFGGNLVSSLVYKLPSYDEVFERSWIDGRVS